MNDFQKKLNKIYEEKLNKLPPSDREDSIFTDKILGDSLREVLTAAPENK